MSAPDHWNRGPAPWGGRSWPPPAQQPWPQGQAGWPAPQQQAWGGRPLQAIQFPPPGQFPPPRRRSPFAALLRALVIIGVVLFAFSAMRTLAGMLTPAATRTVPSTTTQSTAKATATAGTTTASASGGYANDSYVAPQPDYNPSEIPYPQTQSQVNSFVQANRIYGQSIAAPTRCTAPRISATASGKTLESQLNDEIACLMRAWAPPIQAAGFELPRPPVTVYQSSVTTACGNMKEVNAMYCAADQHIYYSSRLMASMPSAIAQADYASEMILAHEFGHTIQARTGILMGEAILEDKASKADAAALSRRAEQQADCFAGLYVASVAQSQKLTAANLKSLAGVAYNTGDDVLAGKAGYSGDHGLGANRQAWFTTGVGTQTVGACNTFTAPAQKVG